MAVKKVTILEEITEARRVFREIKILKNLNHANVLNIYEIIAVRGMLPSFPGHHFLAQSCITSSTSLPASRHMHTWPRARPGAWDHCGKRASHAFTVLILEVADKQALDITSFTGPLPPSPPKKILLTNPNAAVCL